MGPYTLVPTTAFLAQSGATTGNGGIFMPRGVTRYLTCVVEGVATGTITGGVVTLEEAYWPDTAPPNAGTWSTITTINTSGVSSGAQQIVHVQASAWAVRARISTAVSGGGTINVTLWGN